MRDELRESLAFLPRRSELWIWISKPSESRIKKFICGRSLPTAALSVEGPTKNKLCRTILVSSHPPKPMVNERGLSDPTPGNNRNDVDILVCPYMIQKSDILVSTKNITSCNGQSGYGNLLRCKSCSRLASSDARIGRGPLLNALTSDSTPCVDRGHHRRHRLQKFSRVLKTPTGVLLEEYLNENNDRLRHVVQFSNRQRCMQVPVHQLGRCALEWRLPSQHLPKRRAQRVEVRADVDLHSRELLGTGKIRGPDKAPRH